METTVEKLEAMFLKSEADLELIEKRLKLDFIKSAAENGRPAEENPAVMLEKLTAVKAKHAALCSQVKEIADAQKESMDAIRNDLSSAMELVRHLQHTTEVEVQPLSESERESAELLGSAPTTTQTPPAAAASSGHQQPIGCEYEELSDATWKSVPLRIRSNVSLDDLNVFYQQLQQQFHLDSSPLSLQQMKQLKMKVSDTKLKVLQHLELVELDPKGNVHLVM